MIELHNNHLRCHQYTLEMSIRYQLLKKLFRHSILYWRYNHIFKGPILVRVFQTNRTNRICVCVYVQRQTGKQIATVPSGRYCHGAKGWGKDSFVWHGLFEEGLMEWAVWEKTVELSRQRRQVATHAMAAQMAQHSRPGLTTAGQDVREATGGETGE